MSELTLHPDRLFPPEATTRGVASRLYDQVKDLPIISPHGHVPPEWIAKDIPFRDPASLLITPDHYVGRIMHAHGVDLARLGVAQGELDETASRAAFRTLCEHWHLYAGTPVRYWLENEFVDIFGIDEVPTAENADRLYDAVSEWISRPTSRPRALMESFDIEFIATTDDPCDTLEHHIALAQDPSFTRRMAPCFRPDAYLEPARKDWNERTDRLADVSGVSIDSYADWVAAMENRRAFFKENGAVSTDHSHKDLRTDVLPEGEAERIFREARAGSASRVECEALQRHMLSEMARMAADDGLTMTLHPAVARNHDPATLRDFGADVGGDVPISVEATRALQPLLTRYGNTGTFNLVVFTMDETIFGRELGPLAGFYRNMYVGVPWWFIDAPDAIRRFRKAVTEPAGFHKTSGFIDDTRAFCSIPARHDMSRRLDCVHLADLVVEHRLSEDEAARIAHELVVDIPRKVFTL
ncbi:glucuronate isomerase [Mobilicoccus caccae]|uniref:Uronate isomerase n=1 Tax=Mobilicoccus caccae TaxID=1859295 RepID=A0ABQ6ILS6_9MICO|nr:glucuronate isomerase [Mobilicoccus caccae]GMA38158.1 uronate isomerase [Mobilicoccus caccae]